MPLAERRVALRPLALPAEHGAWGFLLEPIALGLLIAPSMTGVLIALGSVSAFLARHPLKLALHDWLRGKSYPRTRACAWLAAGYGALACALFAFVPLRALLFLALALPFALAQFAYDVRGRGRALAPELFGVIASGAIAASIASDATLWLLLALRGVPSLLYVRSALRGTPRAPMIAAHVLAVIVAASIKPIAGFAMLLLLLRAIPAVKAPAKIVGMRELAWGAITVGLFAL
jgi:hypothetical protein